MDYIYNQGSNFIYSVKLQAEHDDVTEDIMAGNLFKYKTFINSILKNYDPELCIIWHQFRGRHIILSELCKTCNIPYLFTEFGILPGTIAFDSEGQMAESWVTQKADEFKNLPVSKDDLKSAG